jgi:thiol-disulfide isomerase/thioredoxin
MPICNRIHSFDVTALQMTPGLKHVQMKQYLFFAVFLLFGYSIRAQTNTEAPFKRFPTLPPFNLLGADSTRLTKDSLQKNKQTLIMYFSPTCEHCQHQMEDMIKYAEDLKDIQIIMATYSPMNELTDFINQYTLNRFPNIRTGRDTQYMLQPFYKIAGLPYQALYDASGNLITTFEGNVKIEKLLLAFEKKDQAL